MYSLIALDMDGTLLDSHKQVLPSSKKALKDAYQAGKYVCLSTGRGFAELKDYADLFPYLSYGILISGGCLYDFKTNTILSKTCLKKSDIKKIQEVIVTRDVMVQVLTSQSSITKRDQVAHMEDYHMGIYQNMYERVCDFVDDPLTDAYTRDDCIKINLYHTSEKEREKTYVQLKDLPFELAYAEETSLEISPMHVSKGAGLKKIAQHLHLDLASTIAIGDAPNDLDILKTAGLSVAMGNSVPEVLKVCDQITLDHDHDGIASIINQYLLEV